MKKGSNWEVKRDIKRWGERTNTMMIFSEKGKMCSEFYFLFIFFTSGTGRRRASGVWAGLLMHCSQQTGRVRALRYQSVSQTQSPWIHSHTHTNTHTHLFLKIEATCQGEIQLSVWKLVFESIQDVSAYLSTYSIHLGSVHRPIISYSFLLQVPAL